LRSRRSGSGSNGILALAGRWLPPLAWMGLIFFLSAQPSLPQAPEPWIDVLLKKGGHGVGYGILAWLYLRALRGNGKASDGLRLVSLGLAVAYGIADEFHQAFVPGRTPSALDVLVDGAGATLAMALGWWRSRALARASQERSGRKAPPEGPGPGPV
jgi:VanZ family protein